MSNSCVAASGVVASGRGNARRHIHEHAEELRLLTAERLVPGSLNVLLDAPLSLSNQTALRFADGRRLLWPATLERVPVWLYRWEHAPLHVVEVLAETRLRDRLELQDGDEVEIEIEECHVQPLTPARHIAWLALWAGRKDWAYTHDRYYLATRPFAIDLGATQHDGEHHFMNTLARQLYHRVKRLPVLGPLANGLRRLVRTTPDEGDGRYVFERDDPAGCEDARDEEFVRIRNILNYTKTSGTAYAAKQYPAGYHSLELFGRQLPGQRDPRLRFRNLPFDFRGKRVLDIGTNQGGMLLAIRDRIELGVGLDYDPRMVNAATRLAASSGAANLHFFVFDLQKDPLELIPDLVPGGRVDVVFLLSVCMWIENWRDVIRFCATNADAMVFESNGSDAQQLDQETELHAHYRHVRLIEDSSEDDPSQKRRRLFLCEEPVRALADETAPEILPATA